MKSLQNCEIDRLEYESVSKAENENGAKDFNSLFIYTRQWKNRIKGMFQRLGLPVQLGSELP